MHRTHRWLLTCSISACIAATSTRDAHAHGDVDESRHEKSEAKVDPDAELPAKPNEKAPAGYHAETRRSGGWLAGGILVLGVGYGVGIGMGSQKCSGPSCYGAWPYVPIVGPIVASIAASNGDSALRAGLAIDGVVQGLSIWMIVLGLSTHDVWVKDAHATWTLTPFASNGARGLALSGVF